MINKEKKKLLHVHIPKTGGWTVQTLLEGLGLLQHHGHRFARDIKYSLGVSFDSQFKFTFTRNPWSRLVSVYSFCKNGSEILPPYVGTRRNPPEHIHFDRLKCDSFDEFVNVLWDLNEDRGDVYMTPLSETPSNEVATNNANYLTLNQYNWIFDDSDKCLVDYIGRLEEFNEGMKDINTLSGYNLITPPKRNSSSHRHYSEYYNDKTKNIVSRLYERDIDTFKYTFL